MNDICFYSSNKELLLDNSEEAHRPESTVSISSGVFHQGMTLANNPGPSEPLAKDSHYVASEDTHLKG